MDKAFKVIFPVSLLIGFVLLFIEKTFSIGISVLTLILPLLLLHYITFFRRTIKEENIILRLRSPFLITLIMTIILVPISVLFKIFHSPFATIFLSLAYTLGFITSLLAIIYIYLNRKIINQRLVYELIILVVPIVALSINISIVNSVNKNDYAKDIHKYYYSLKRTQNLLNETRQTDSTAIDSIFTQLEVDKKELILYSGGETDDKMIKGWMDKSVPEIKLIHSSRLVGLYKSRLISDELKTKLKESKTVMDFLIVFTEIQNDLLIKK